MTKLNQIVAVEQGVKSKARDAITALYHKAQKSALFSGINRTYKPKDEEGDQLPSESTKVQVTVPDLLNEAEDALTKLFNVTAIKEYSNAHASADLKVDGQTLLTDVPVPYLLFLEKQLVDLRTFITKLPTLDQASEWVYDGNNDIYKTTPVQTVRTKKVPRNWVKAEATDKHPAQVEIFHEDVIVGTWTKVDTSGAIPVTRRNELLERVDKLIQAVKFAREEANQYEVTDEDAAGPIFRYLFS
jgi:vacuolar-type H+-ATPase subunit I/STV1